MQKRGFAEKRLIGRCAPQQVVAQFQAVLHDDPAVRGAFFPDHVEASLERTLERHNLAKVLAAAGQRDEEQQRFVADHFPLREVIHQPPDARRIGHDRGLHLERVRRAQRREQLHGVVPHVEVALVQEGHDEVEVRGSSKKRIRVGGTRVREVGTLVARVHSCVGTPFGTRAAARECVDEYLQYAVHELRVVSFLGERGDQGWQADDSDGELGHA